MATGTTDNKLDVCCATEYRPLPGIPGGQLIKIADLDTYYISGKDQTSKGKAIVLLTDIFGLTKNIRIIADEVSEKSGFDVYVPDLFIGDAIHSSWMKRFPEQVGEKMSIGARLSHAGSLVTSLGPWLFRHRQSVTLPLVQNFFQTLRSEKSVTKIQAVGYCFGGLYALLAGGKLHLVDAIVGCHVSLTNKTHFEQLEVPAAFACAQEDNQFSDALRATAEEILSRKRDLPSKFMLTKGTLHGFASRPNPDNPVIMAAFKQANDLIAEWAKTHL
ncbi:unnamed protein product [Adineta steineri]|uniref:Dienelactone hydrolase domain-containing protein n=2 Tax=Adineta steineri TaxID=433720 RepID=A0A815GBY3_9BILA|nr:unnamed protein product [Adineta steineri]CAF3708630.1 unnamed protein product [Adineta steineri]